MSNLQLLEDYEEEYTKINELLNKKQSLPESFCAFFTEIQTISPDPTVQKEVDSLFQDVNTEIEKYNQQFQILVSELGVLCQVNSDQGSLVVQFFQALLDLFGLALNTYRDYPEKLKVFYSLLSKFKTLLETQKIKLEQDPLQRALLLQLTKSAWALTQTEKDMGLYAKSLRKVGGKRKTRKHRRSTA